MSKKAEIAKVLEQLLSGEVDLSEVREALGKITDRVVELEKSQGSQPLMHVKVADLPVIKLKGPASPYLEECLVNAVNGLHTMLVGPPGCGKTTLAAQLAEALKVPFAAVCLTAGASETWLFGRQTPTGFVDGPFSTLYREGGVFLADEMDAADANLLLSINTALSHNEMLNPMNGEKITRHPKFVFIGAANTNGKGATHLMTGRTRLDAATLDRMEIVLVDYNHDVEAKVCPNASLYRYLNAVRAQLLAAKSDDFVSTRKFISASKKLAAGREIGAIVASLAANWSDQARVIAIKLLAERASEFKKDDGKDTPPKKRGRPVKMKVGGISTNVIVEDEVTDWELLK